MNRPAFNLTQIFDLSRHLTAIQGRAVGKAGTPDQQFGTVSASYSSGNPALVLPGEATASAGPKTHRVLQMAGNRFAALAASDKVSIAADNDGNRTVAGKTTDVGSTITDAEYLMGLRPVTPGNTVLDSANTQRSTTSTVFVLVKEFQVYAPGKYRLTFDLSRTGGTTQAIVKIRRLDGLYDTASATASYIGTVFPVFGSQSLDMTVSAKWGDMVSVWLLNDSGPGQTGYLQNCAIKYSDATAVLAQNHSVITD